MYEYIYIYVVKSVYIQYHNIIKQNIIHLNVSFFVLFDHNNCRYLRVYVIICIHIFENVRTFRRPNKVSSTNNYYLLGTYQL